METCELFNLIPREKLDYLFANSHAGAELDCTFLAFEHVYKEVLEVTSKDKTIIDLGCAYATQSWYFKDHKKYIGVDDFSNSDSVIHTDNSEFYFMTIQEFIREVLPSLDLNLNDVFAVCFYVPDKDAQDLVVKTFPYCRVYYPGGISIMNLPEHTPQKLSLDAQIQSAHRKSQDCSISHSLDENLTLSIYDGGFNYEL